MLQICFFLCYKFVINFSLIIFLKRKATYKLPTFYFSEENYECYSMLMSLQFKFLIVKTNFSEKNSVLHYQLPCVDQSESKYWLRPQTLWPKHWAARNQPGSGTRLLGILDDMVLLPWTSDATLFAMTTAPWRMDAHAITTFPSTDFITLGYLFSIESWRLEQRLN